MTRYLEWFFPMARCLRLRVTPSWARSIATGLTALIAQWPVLLAVGYLQFIGIRNYFVRAAARPSAAVSWQEYAEMTRYGAHMVGNWLSLLAPLVVAHLTVCLVMPLADKKSDIRRIGPYLREALPLATKLTLLSMRTWLFSLALFFGLFAGGMSVMWVARRSRWSLLPVVMLCILTFLASVGTALRTSLAVMLQRSRHEYCRRCGYHLIGLTAPRCPECGEPFDPTMLERLGVENRRGQE